MTQDIFGSLFDLQDARLEKLGNPLLALENHIDWDGFRDQLNSVHDKERKSRAGAPTKDPVM